MASPGPGLCDGARDPLGPHWGPSSTPTASSPLPRCSPRDPRAACFRAHLLSFRPQTRTRVNTVLQDKRGACCQGGSWPDPTISARGLDLSAAMPSPPPPRLAGPFRPGRAAALGLCLYLGSCGARLALREERTVTTQSDQGAGSKREGQGLTCFIPAHEVKSSPCTNYL